MDENKKSVLLEGNSLIGKIFYTALGTYLGASLLGKVVNAKIRGTESQINAVYNAMWASKKFHDELKKPGATVDSVVQSLSAKHMTTREFEKVFGIPWPL